MPRISSITSQALTGIRSADRWALLHILNNPNPYSTGEDDFFGTAVAISGNYVIVGAEGEDEAGSNESGKAYIFDVLSGNLLQTINNPNAYNTPSIDYFGSEIAASGNYALITAQGEDDATTTFGSGKVYIFNINTGDLIFTLDNPTPFGTGQSDNFGARLAIEGNYAIVTAFGEDEAAGTNSGKAYIYRTITGDWTDVSLLYTLNNPNAVGTVASDLFGTGLAMSGNYAIIGASGEDEPGFLNSGKAYIYDVTTGTLVYTLSNPNAFSTPADDNFGSNVAMLGNYAIISASGEDDDNGIISGKAYIYRTITGDWTDVSLVHTLNNPSPDGNSSSDAFRWVAISSKYAIVGAPGEGIGPINVDSGKAYVFDILSGRLVQILNNPNAYGTPANDDFSFAAVAMSEDYAVIGAVDEDDATGVNSGKVYIYKRLS